MRSANQTRMEPMEGAWERTVRDTGRVGSIFEPAGGLASNLVSRDDPEDPDELERRRQQERSGGVTDPDRTDGQDQEEADEETDEEPERQGSGTSRTKARGHRRRERR